MKWFKHDSDAHLDTKLKRVRMKYGLEGYGLYWYCLESIAKGIDDNNFTFELEDDAEIISHDTGIHIERVNEMMTYMVNLGLFEESSGRITCLKLLKRMDQSMTSNKRMRLLVNNAKANHDSVMTQSANVMQEEEEEEEEDKKRRRIEEKKKKPYVDVQQAETPTSGVNKRQKPIQYEKIKDAYNDHFGYEAWARASSILTDKVRKQIAKINPHFDSINSWCHYFKYCASDPWINGNNRDSDWKPNIDYLTREKTYAQMADKLEDQKHGSI